MLDRAAEILHLEIERPARRSVALPEEEAVAQALDQLSGEANTGIVQAVYQSVGNFINSMLNPFNGGRGNFGPATPYAAESDDPDADVRAAQRVGLRGVLVLTGKTTAAQMDQPSTGRGRRAPDAVAPSLADVVRALG